MTRPLALFSAALSVLAGVALGAMIDRAVFPQIPDPTDSVICQHAMQSQMVRDGWDLKGLNFAIRESLDMKKHSAGYPPSQNTLTTFKTQISGRSETKQKGEPK